jgi:thiosulfate/3-mercaptopyruvate sulfurtransferase
MGALGVGPSTRVVAYSSDAPMWACRIWWLLRYFGFDDVRVLDGGLASWRKAGYPLSTETAATAPAPFVAKVRPELLATKDDILAVLAGRGTCLVNALSPETFRGEVNPYFRPGRIPGSLNVPAHNLIDQHTGCFRPAFELAAELGDLAHAGQPTPAIVYCGGGISATVDIFALAILGRDDVRLYDGSLNEWSADPRLALEVG